MDTSNSSYEVFLVIPTDQTQETVSVCLKEAYEQLTANEMDSTWINSEECLNLDRANGLFICDPFSGEAFNHLQKIGCRIMGPQCLLTCLRDESNLPKRPRPIFCLNMRGVVVTFSNIPPANKKKLRELVLLMGGECPNSLTLSCTHLVTGYVGSDKYHTAVKQKLPIMTPEWVVVCWSDAQKCDSVLPHSTDAIYNAYKCKPFYGLTVTASQVDSKERHKIQSLVTENGGKYLGAMKQKETTHLVLETPNGTKFQYACDWKIKCVTMAWITDCVAAGSFLSESDYELQPDINIRQNKASTPKKEEEPLPAPNCSMLFPSGLKDHINETCLSNVSFILAPAKSAQSRTIKNSSGTKHEKSVDNVSDQTALPNLSNSGCLNALNLQKNSNKLSSKKSNTSQVENMETEKSSKDLEAENSFGKTSTFVSELNSHSETSKVSIFSEMKFVVVDPNPGDHSLLVEMLESHGGTVLKSAERSEKDCVWIVPVVEFGHHTVPMTLTVRTNFWVQICIEQQALQPVNVHRLFQPICVTSTENPPLIGCTLAFSQFSVSDKDCLVYLANTLGAKCSEYFVRAENKKKGLLPNTHLVLEVPEGNKYEAARKWGIPAVRKEWLFQAAMLNKRPDEQMYLIDGPAPELVENVLAQNNLSNLSTRDATENDALDLEPRPKDNIPTFISHDRSKLEITNKEPECFFKVKTDNLNAGFDVSEAIEMLKSRKKKSMSLEEKANHYFSIAQKNFGIDSPGQHTTVSNSATSTPLLGVVLCVSRKLVSQQKKLHSITEKLGGRVLWSYDDSCTHLVHQGRGSDHFGYGTKELRQAQAHSKFIVCPDWLYACEESQSRVNETDFPYNYNPRLSLSGQFTSEKVLSQDERKFEESLDNTSNWELKHFTKSFAHDHSKSSAPTSGSKIRSVSLDDAPIRNASKSVETTPNTDLSESSDVSKRLQVLMTVRKRTLIPNTVQRASPQNTEFQIEQLKLKPQSNLETETQPSQSIPIMWEDPTEKTEQERLARNPIPPPDTQSQVPDLDEQQFEKDDDDDELNDALTQKPPQKNIFLLSGLQEENKIKFISIVEQLGGTVVDSYNTQVTHLVCETPTKNEKILSSLAAGLWILHPSFIHACQKASRFLPEEEFEWGSEFMKLRMQKMSTKVQKVAMAAHVWRTRITDTCKKAFHNWEVKLCVPQQRLSAYTCILKAGGARVVDDFTPGFSFAKYAFLEGSFDVDIFELESEGVTCAKPEYFSAILVETPVPSASLYAVKGRRDQNSSVVSHKRRTNSAETVSKKNRST